MCQGAAPPGGSNPAGRGATPATGAPPVSSPPQIPGSATPAQSTWAPRNVVTFGDAQRNAQGQGLNATGAAPEGSWAQTGKFAGSGYDPSTAMPWQQRRDEWFAGQAARTAAVNAARQPSGMPPAVAPPVAPPPGVVLHGDPQDAMNVAAPPVRTGGLTPRVWGDPQNQMGGGQRLHGDPRTMRGPQGTVLHGDPRTAITNALLNRGGR